MEKECNYLYGDCFGFFGGGEDVRMHEGKARYESLCPAPLATLLSFLPGLNFSNCSRQALEKALLDGMGSCLFERLPRLAPMSSMCGNMFVDPGEQCDCGFPDVSL